MDSRRSFFKQVLGDVARGVYEINEIVKAPAASPDTPDGPLIEPLAAAPPPPAPAPPTTRGATLDELLVLADEVGLGARRDDVRRLARASVRLTPAVDGAPTTAGGSRLGGAPDLPDGVAWPHWRDAPLEFRLQLDLAQLAAVLADCGVEVPGLPTSGLLACFSAAEPPDGMRPDHRGACAVLLTDPPAPGAEPAYGEPAALSRELVLPRTWAAPVTALELGRGEPAMWTELRRRLAQAQGVEPFDEAPQVEVPHRVLGYPDERRGAMPLACALLAEDLDLGGGPPSSHPRGRALQPEAARWRPLLQLAVDGEIGWQWGTRRECLYVWAHEDDLAAGELGRVRAFVQ